MADDCEGVFIILNIKHLNRILATIFSLLLILNTTFFTTNATDKVKGNKDENENSIEVGLDENKNSGFNDIADDKEEQNEEDYIEERGNDKAYEEPTELFKQLDYIDAYEEFEKNGYTYPSETEITLTLDDLIMDEQLTEIVKVKGKRGIVSDVNSKIKYKFKIEESGLYNLGSTYYLSEKTGIAAMRSILIDGKSPYLEMSQVPFYRVWKDDGLPKTNVLGDEITPIAEEIETWQTSNFFDNAGKYSVPLEIYLETGEHTLEIEHIDQVVIFSEIIISSAKSMKTYEQCLREWESSGIEKVKGFSEKYQAEDSMTWRNDSAFGLTSDGDPKAEPDSIGKIKLNTVGDYSFRTGGQKLVLEVNVDKAGLYYLNFRALQSWGGNLPSFRKIEINGEVPFKEFEDINFNFSRRWQNIIPSNDASKYLVKLNSGINEIALTVVLGAYTLPIKEINESLEDLSDLMRQITMITGAQPDPNYDYELDKIIPDLAEQFSQLANKLQDVVKEINSYSVKKDSVVGNSIETVIKQLKEIAEKPESTPKRLSDLRNMSVTLGDVLVTLSHQPLQLDYIEVLSEECLPNSQDSNFVDRLIVTLKNFYYSFFKDYNTIYTTSEGGKTEKTLSVWIGRGREWATILKELSDSDFTQKYNTSINMNVIPAGQISGTGSVNPLMLAISAGDAPDVVMSVSSNLPVEYSFRNAVADLRNFKNFEKVKDRFLPEIMVPFENNGAIYGVPETMYFRGMFYRKDIIEELNIKIPETWDELVHDVLPILYENGMDFYLPAWYDMFLLRLCKVNMKE